MARLLELCCRVLNCFGPLAMRLCSRAAARRRDATVVQCYVTPVTRGVTPFDDATSREITPLTRDLTPVVQLDDALLRPGRLEVKLEVSLPDALGRRDILRIHTRAMRANEVRHALCSGTQCGAVRSV